MTNERQEPRFQYAPPGTLAGKLQRGLGTGFLEALETPREALHPLLMECIAVDPRLDHQIDVRQWYYGELVHRMEVPVAPIAKLLRDWGETDEFGDSWIALAVLQHLTKRGNEEAGEVLRDYVRWGHWWDDVLADLQSLATTDAWLALAGPLAERAMVYPGQRNWDDEPYPSFAEQDSRFRDLRARSVKQSAKWKRTRPRFSQWSTDRLLHEYAIGQARTQVSDELARRLCVDDDSEIRDALHAKDIYTRAVAALALAKCGDFSAFDVAAELASVQQRPAAAAVVATDALKLAPASMGLALARQWRSSRRYRRRIAAYDLLEAHATKEDLAWLRTALYRTPPDDALKSYELCHLAEIVTARLPGHRFPVLGHRFDAFTYSHGRGRLAQALAVTDPTFNSTRAFPSLWDCESDVRVVAAEHVWLAVPGAIERLREMAADPLEDDERVHEVVERRLAERTT